MFMSIGKVAPDFILPATDGGHYDFAGVAGEKATVLLFWCNHCPYVQPNQKRIIAMQAEFGPQGVGFAAICANNAEAYPLDSFEHMKQRAEEQGYNFPYLHDEDQSVARAYKAQRTPEAFLFDSKRVLRYHGRIDDNYQDVDKAQSHDLRRAIEAVLAGQAPDPAETGAVGCSIKWK